MFRQSLRRLPWFWLLLIGGTALAIGVVWFSQIPLGVSGEWEWTRVAPESAADIVFALMAAGLVAAAYMAYVGFGANRFAKAGRWERGLWIAGLWAAGFSWLWMAQESAPPGFQLSRATWVLYFRGTSGYFSEARYSTTALPEFLAGYEQRMAQGDVLHIGTHPPGLVLAFRGLIALVNRFPALANGVLATQPATVREAFDVIAQHALQAEPVTRDDRAVLWLAALLVMCLASATVLPLYGLLRFDHTPATSWLAASFWPVLPGLALFLPKSDALLPCLGTGFLYLWLAGGRRGSLLLCAAAGVVLWLGLLTSLALLPVVLLAALLTGRDVLAPQPASVPPGAVVPERRRPELLRCTLAGGVGFLLPCVALGVASGMNVFRVWAWNYANHAGFYGQFPRTYWKWLLVNPLELAFSAGPPLALIALWTGVQCVQRKDRRGASLFLACAGTWLLLLFSGKNMGEAARLWLILTPWLILAGAAFFDDRPVTPGGRRQLPPLPRWGIVLGCQFAVTLGIATRIVGFTVPGANVSSVTTTVTTVTTDRLIESGVPRQPGRWSTAIWVPKTN